MCSVDSFLSKFWQKAFEEPTGKQKLLLLAEMQLGHTGDSKKPLSSFWDLRQSYLVVKQERFLQNQ